MIKPKNLPNESQIEAFVGFMTKWQIKLGLTDWDIAHSKKKAAPGACLDITPDLVQRTASYRLGDFRGETITDNYLERGAVHELLHLHTAELIEACKTPKNIDRIRSVEHRLINSVDRLLVPPVET